jgi:hypothetical protein
MSDRLDRIHNPMGDWTIRDIEALCREYGIVCEPARGGGSHYKVAHPQMIEKLPSPINVRLNPYIFEDPLPLSMR